MKGRLQKLKDVAKKLGREQENQAGTRAVRELLLHLLLKLLFMVVTHLFLLLSYSFPPSSSSSSSSSSLFFLGQYSKVESLFLPNKQT